MSDESGAWEFDVLNRRAHAEFLTDYLSRRTLANSGAGSFTVAVDAEWGQGKSFFVRNWARALDAATTRKPVFVFDAWSADYAADPLVAFMAELKIALSREVERAGLTDGAKDAAKKKVEAVVKSARRAIMPATKVIAAGLVKKAFGVAVDEVVSAITESNSDTDENKLLEDGREAVEKGLDEFFNKALAGHSERAASIAEFRALLESTLSDIFTSGTGVTGPMYVFVDELDRCRPNFAIALLEGMKHLFGVKGVCFIVSTNLRELGESVKAVYGSGFNGYAYLKRFFDVQISLPRANSADYADALLKEFNNTLPAKIELGLPTRIVGGKRTKEVAFAWVVDTFGLDLRAQRQVLEMFVAASSSLSKGNHPIHFVWLLSLCSLRHRSSETFEAFSRLGKGAGAAQVQEIFNQVKWIKTPLRFDVPAEGRLDTKQINLLELCTVYLQMSRDDLTVTQQSAHGLGSSDYPQSLKRVLVQELPSPLYLDRPYPPSLVSYAEAVRTAGHVGIIDAPIA